MLISVGFISYINYFLKMFCAFGRSLRVGLYAAIFLLVPRKKPSSR